jgi:RHS repeat-associated protein
MNLWTFDVSISEWRIYGTGTVSADGKQVVPDIDPMTRRPYGLPRFAWHFPAPPPCTDPSSCPCPTCCSGGDPVALTSGAFYEMKADIGLQGRFPISITRIYQTGNTNPGPFGIGTLDVNYGHRIQQEGTSFLYVVPSSRAFRFTAIAGRPDQFENTTEPSLRGAVLTRVAGEFNFTLRMKDGTVMRFDRIVGFTNLAALTALTDRNGNTVTLTRSSPGPGRFGILAEVRDPDGRTLRLDYDDSGRVTSVTEPLGRRVTYTYNAAGYLETVTNPEGGVTRYRYDGQGRMTEVTNPRGIRVVLNEYDTNGRVRRQTHADGGVFTYDYTVVGGLITEVKLTDPRSGATTYRFNCMSYPVSVTDANGQVTLADRSIGTNRINFTQDALGRKTELEYDERGNVIRIKDPAGGIRRFEYEPSFSQVTRMIDELGNVTTNRYDTRGNLIEVIDPEDNSVTNTYNDSGQVRTTRDALGNVTTYEYDTPGPPTAIIDPEGHRTSLSYDAVGRLTARTDPAGQKTRFVYDVMDRIINTIDPLGGRTIFIYDRSGNLLTVTDARGNTVTNTYNSLDRLEQRTDQLGNVDLRTYDENGNLLRFTDRRDHTSSFMYDGLNRLIRTTRTDGSTTEQTYDSLGHLTRVNDSVSGVVEFGHDVLGRLAREVTPQGALSYEYDAASRRTRVTVAGQPDVIYRYDRASQLRQVQQGSDVVIIDYDRAGRRAKLTLPNGTSTEYTYDRAGQLTNLTYKRRDGTILDMVSYAYDASGRRVNLRGTRPYGTPPDPVTITEYNRANQLLRFANKTFTYDRNGNLETQTEPSGTTRYRWDTRNRLLSIDGPGLQARFTYDALGRRVGTTINGQSKSYLYDGQNMVREVSDSRVLASYLRGLQIDETFTRVEETRKSHYVSDALNSTLFLTDDNGNRIQQYAYDPFGRIVSQSGTVNQPFTYTGRESEAVPALYFYRARYYDSLAGRFISEDPIGFDSGDLNLYRYVGNNPVNFIDPMGLICTKPFTQGCFKCRFCIDTVTGGGPACKAIVKNREPTPAQLGQCALEMGVMMELRCSF